MKQHETHYDQAECMIKVILHTGLVYGQHISGERLLQPVRAERAQSDTEKCIDCAQREKDFWGHIFVERADRI